MAIVAAVATVAAVTPVHQAMRRQGADEKENIAVAARKQVNPVLVDQKHGHDHKKRRKRQSGPAAPEPERFSGTVWRMLISDHVYLQHVRKAPMAPQTGSCALMSRKDARRGVALQNR